VSTSTQQRRELSHRRQRAVLVLPPNANPQFDTNVCVFGSTDLDPAQPADAVRSAGRAARMPRPATHREGVLILLDAKDGTSPML